MIGLATMATVIASQAIISGAFSLTLQASRLGYLPRLEIRHTSRQRAGQIYIPAVNWILLMATVGLVITFASSGSLASAYGIAITATMVITTVLLLVAMRTVLDWPWWMVASAGVIFLVMDLTFFVANVRKVLDGGWFPLLVAGMVYFVMATWRQGYASERRKSRNRIVPVRDFLAEIGGGGKYRRVPGQAVYLTSNARGTPHSFRHNLEHNRALHDRVVLYTATFVKAPHVPPEERLKISRLRDDITRVVAYYGYLENPDVPGDLRDASRQEDLKLDLERITYFVGGDTLLARSKAGTDSWRSALYALLAKNEARATRHFNLPPDQVFEIGAQIRV
jgi:KUP system potassium uptake protein